MMPNLLTMSPWVWSSLLAAAIALPILIHLINRYRHQTVRWAAMDFLMKSYRRHRNWIWLKQMLLLLSRIAALLLSLLLLSQARCQNEEVALLMGNQPTHHVLILDDSYSMQDRSDGRSAFDRALQAMRLIIQRQRGNTNQRLSILRTSQIQLAEAARQAANDSANVNRFEIENVALTNETESQLESLLTQLSPSEMSGGIDLAFDQIDRMAKQEAGQRIAVYLLSDFREKDWGDTDSIVQATGSLKRAGGSLELVDCGVKSETNLTIQRLQPTGYVRAAKTPVMIEVQVANLGQQVVRNQTVRVFMLAFDEPGRSSQPGDQAPQTTELPSVFLEAIEPGETLARTFPVYFDSPGHHGVLVQLADDVLAPDNERYLDLQVEQAVKVLLIDDTNLAAPRFQLALNPNDSTGIQAEVQTRAALRGLSQEALANYDVIYLLDVAGVEQSTAERLEDYVRSGGGLACFCGPDTNARSFNQWLYRDGDGVMPMPLDRVIEVPESDADEEADLQPSQHPIFEPSLSVRNSLLDLVKVSRRWQPPIEWNLKVEARQGVQVLATLRGQSDQPLVLEKQFGEGRVIQVNTTADSRWNGWMRNATFVPTMLLMENYLAAGNYRTAELLVGESVQVRVPLSDYLEDASVIRRRWDPTAGQSDADAEAVSLRTDPAARQRVGTPIYLANAQWLETWLKPANRQAKPEVRRVAVNVQTDESRLLRAKRKQLEQRFDGLEVVFTSWDRLAGLEADTGRNSMSRFLLAVLVLVLFAEQSLAWATNYHRPR